MHMSKKPKNIIITGASKGIGEAIAGKFAAGNHNIFLCARNEEQLYKTTEELQTRFPAVLISAMPADVSKKEQVVSFGNWVLKQTESTGGPDVLVNNAGVFFPGGITTEEDGLLERTMETNVYSAYHLTRTLLPKMMENRHGHVFNICSVASLQAYKSGAAYSISKFALLGFSKNLREEMKPHGVKVTAVIPGAVYTGSWKESDVSPQRIMEPDDIATLVYAASCLSSQAVTEDIIIRPQLGDV